MPDRIVTPAAPTYLAADFAAAFLALLPLGPAWPRDGDADLAKTASALMPTQERFAARAAALLQESPAGAPTETLGEWEASLGLPDPCLGPSPTIEQRQRGVRAAIAARGGQSIPYFVGVAASLGYAVTVREFTCARADVSCADDPVTDEAWAHAWLVTFPGPAPGSPTVAECVLGRIAPAHTVLIFAYSA